MANPTIAALRAASSAAPAGPSGPQALAYPWMTATGRELVLPDRSSSPPPPKRRPLPDPSPPPPGRPIIQPPLPPRDGGGRRGEAPGRGGDGGGWSYIGDWGNDVPPYAVIDPNYVPPSEPSPEPPSEPAPPSEPPVEPRPEPPGRRDADQFEYLPVMDFIQPVPFAEAGPVESQPVQPPPSEPQEAPQRGRDQFEFLPAQMEDFALMDSIPSMPREDLIMTTMPIRGFDPSPAVEAPPAVEVAPDPVPYIPQIVEPPPAIPAFAAPAPAVEVAPEPIPYMPQIVEPEAPPPAPPPQPKLPQPVLQTLPDLSLMDFIQPVPMAELAPEVAPEVVPQMSPAEQQEMDRFLLEYLMSQDMAVME